jgi:hypothetical protein
MDMGMDILCFTEHWMCIDQIRSISLEHHQLASNFSRSSRKGGGSCIFVINETRAKEVNYLKDLAHEINFELSAVELMDLKTVVVCIYRSPDGDYEEFLQNLEVVIYRVQASQKRLILCGDWNVDFLKKNSKVQELKALLSMFNLINIIDSPTRFSREVKSQIDVIIIENLNCQVQIRNIDVGYSGHLAQILYFNVYASFRNLIRNMKIVFSDTNIDEFNLLLREETWDDVLKLEDVNISYEIFYQLFKHYFDRAFPIKLNSMRKNKRKKRWVTKGILVSKRRMCFLNRIKRVNSFNPRSTRIYK